MKLHKYILLKSAKSAETRPPMETGVILIRYVSPSVHPSRDLPVCWVVLARACWSFKGRLSGGMEGGRRTLCCVRYLGHSQQLLRFPPSLFCFFFPLCVHTHMLDALAQPTERTHSRLPRRLPHPINLCLLPQCSRLAHKPRAVRLSATGAAKIHFSS